MSVTLRALKPYLLVHKWLGLLPHHLSDDGTAVRWKRLSWSSVYSCLVVTMFAFYFVDASAFQIDLSASDSHKIFESAKSFAFVVPVTFTAFTFPTFATRKLCHLLNRMVNFEKDVEQIGSPLKTTGHRMMPISLAYHLQGESMIRVCWTALAMGLLASTINEAVFYLPNFFALSKGDRMSPGSFCAVYTSLDDYWLMTIFYFVIFPFYGPVFWTFVDMSVVLFSLIFKSYLLHLNQLIDQWPEMSLADKENLRLIYWSVQSLIQEADAIFSSGILVGSLSSIGYIILQVYKGLSGTFDDYTTIKINTSVTFIFLVTRLATSSYFAASIDEQLDATKINLHRQMENISSKNEMEILMVSWFSKQLSRSVGFSGCGFFRLGKQFLITIIGTILTYEIVLLQLAAKNKNLGNSTDCH